MTEHPFRARLVNAEFELIAEGPCWLDESAGQATLEPEREPGVIQKERGPLALELETGRLLRVSEVPLVFRLGAQQNGNGQEQSRRLYRLRLIDDAQEADAAGAAGDGTLAPPAGGPFADGQRETPAAR